MQDVADTLGRERVAAVVSDFYDRVRAHPTLARPFAVVHDWPEHKAHIGHFWWVTLGGKPYRSRPYHVAQKHEAAGFTPALLVGETNRRLEETKARVEKIDAIAGDTKKLEAATGEIMAGALKRAEAKVTEARAAVSKVVETKAATEAKVAENEAVEQDEPGTASWSTACARKYRSWDPQKGKYKSYSGKWKPCRL